jgi:dihydroorotase
MHGHNTRAAGPDPEAAAVGAAAVAAPSAAADAHLFAGKTRFSLVSAMTSMMALGLPLERVVPMVTSNAAKMIGMQDELGRLKVGGIADISVLADDRGRWLMQDNEGTRVTAERRLQPLFCLRAGRRFDANAAILPILSAA